MPRAHSIQWTKGVSKGFTDVFAVEGLRQNLKNSLLTHLVRGPKGRTYFSRCRATARGNTVELNYRHFRAFNDREGMLTGVMRLEFDSARRSKLTGVYWDGEAMTPDWVKLRTGYTSQPVTTADVITRRQYEMARRLRRPKQLAMRRMLQEAYGAQCCITDCTLISALAAAHIAPYAETLSSSPRSALLLRMDLHALWDSGDMAVHPVTRKVHFSPEAQACDEYRRMHKSARLRLPKQPEFAPDEKALRLHWKSFDEHHGG